MSGLGYWAGVSACALICALVNVPSQAASAAPGDAPPAWPRLAQAPKDAPNVVVIMTDDVGFGASSTFGGPIPTPSFDRVAAAGLRYNRFHTAALCSPTRASLLTGRNPHAVGFGQVPELATAHPGYTSILPASAATVAQVLRQNGYNTAMFGKNHNTPDWENGPAGPFDRWPTGFGFEYFYGFNGGETDQFTPALLENTLPVGQPTKNGDAYILDRDLADHAIEWLRTHETTAPNRPFFLYYAPGTPHAPHQAPREWIERFKGRFAQGWDAMREQTIVRQKQIGVVPRQTKLTPRHETIPAWNSLKPEERRVSSRMMEVYAATLAHSDHQIGRLLNELERTGQLDNTLIIYIQGDNGGSTEGRISGTTNQTMAYRGVSQDVATLAAQIEEMGGPTTKGNYPVGWAWAMNTPFKLLKTFAGHLGGTRTGMALAWPEKIKERGGLRAQFVNVTDIVPTIYEIIGITPPRIFQGVPQQPIDGVSLVYSFETADAPSRHVSQYFEAFGNGGYYEREWMITAKPNSYSWAPTEAAGRDGAIEWELYDLSRDFSQADDLSKQFPDKVAVLANGFQQAAKRNNVLPLIMPMAARLTTAPRPYAANERSMFSYYQGQTRLTKAAFPEINNRPWTLRAKIRISNAEAQGVVFASGDHFNGITLFLKNGTPTLVYQPTRAARDKIRLNGASPLVLGTHDLTVAFVLKETNGEKLGELVLHVDGIERGKATLRPLAGFNFGGIADSWADVGQDTGGLVTNEYTRENGFTGTVEKLTVETD